MESCQIPDIDPLSLRIVKGIKSRSHPAPSRGNGQVLWAQRVDQASREQVMLLQKWWGCLKVCQNLLTLQQGAGRGAKCQVGSRASMLGPWAPGLCLHFL